MTYISHLSDAYGKTTVTSPSVNTQLVLDGYLSLKQLANDPANTANYGTLYTKTDGKLYYNSVLGVEVVVGGNASLGILNVKNSPYNAVGNGIADDTTAIQNAINDAYSSGLAVFIPEGNYKITSNISLTSNCEIFGIYNKSILNYIQPSPNANAYTFTISGPKQNIYIHDLNFTTQDNLNAASAGIEIFNADGTDNVAYVRCYFSNFLNYPFSNSTFVTNILITDCHISHIYQAPTATGFSVRSFQGGIFTRNFITDINNGNTLSHAVYCPGTWSDAIFANNVIDSCTSGIGFGTSSGPFNYNVTITGNIVKNVRDWCIGVTNAQNVSVSGNTLRPNGFSGSGTSGIIIGPDVHNYTINANTINVDGYFGGSFVNGAYGIYLPYTNYTGSITNNTIGRDDVVSAGAGIAAFIGNNILISGNTIRNLYQGVQIFAQIGPVNYITITNNQSIIESGLTVLPSLGNVNAAVNIDGYTSNLVISNNIFNGHTYGVDIQDSHTFGSGQNAWINHNTVYGATYLVVTETNSAMSNILVENNLTDNNASVTLSGTGTNKLFRNNINITRGFAPDTSFGGSSLDATHIDTLEPPNNATVTNIIGYQSQRVFIKCVNSTCTITNNSNIVLSSGSNFVMLTGDTLTLVQFDLGVWTEIARTKSGTVSVGATGGVASQVAYFTGPSTISSNVNLFWDQTNHRLGIDNASPAQPLDVIGNSKVSGISFIGDGTVSAPGIGFISETGTGVYRPAAGQIGLSVLGGQVLNIDNNSTANIVIGGTAQSTATGAGIAIGYRAKGNGNQSIGLGYFTVALNANSIMIGNQATEAVGTGIQNIAIGTNTSIIGSGTNNAIAMGDFSTVNSSFGVAIGFQSGTGNSQTGVGNKSIALGYINSASGNNTIAIGPSADGYNYNSSVVIGDSGIVPGSNSIAIGTQAGFTSAISGATGNQNIAIGHLAVITSTTALNAIAIGSSASATANNGLAIGTATAGNDSIAMARSATASGSSSIAIGVLSSTSTFNNAIAIGPQTVIGGDYGIGIGYLVGTANAQTSVGSATVAIGYNPSAAGGNSVVIGASADGYNYSRTIAIGAGTIAAGNDSVVIGYNAGLTAQASVTGNQNIAIGHLTSIFNGSIVNALAIGSSAQVQANNAVAIGTTAGLGGGATGIGANSIGIGQSTQSTGSNSIAIGTNASTVAFNSSVAIGNSAAATANNQIVLGTSSETVFIPSTSGASAPALAIAGLTDGIFRVSSGVIGITGSGVETARFSATLTQIPASSIFTFNGRSTIQSTADGYLTLQNNAATGFSGLRFGGITSSFPAIYTNGTSLEVRLADGSAYTNITAANGNFTTGLNVTGTEARATGTLTLTGVPTAGQTFVVSGVTFTAVASGATGNQFNIGVDATTTASNIVSVVNAAGSSNLAVVASSSSGVVTFTSQVYGSYGNSQTLSTTLSNSTVSGSTLTGGFSSSFISGGLVVTGQTDSILFAPINNKTSILMPAGGAIVWGSAQDLSTSANNIYLGSVNDTTINGGAGFDSIVIGAQAFITGGGDRNIAIGQKTFIYNGNRSVVIGSNAASAVDRGVAIGFNAGSAAVGVGQSAVAVGNNTVASGSFSVAIGNTATTSTFTTAVALGAGATATANNQIMLGTSAETAVILGSLGIGTSTTTGGKLRVDGYIVPNVDNAYGLGTSSLRWQSLSVGPGSLHLNSLVSETGIARDWRLAIETTGGQLQGAMHISNNGNKTLTLDAYGQVGIGASVVPNATLTIDGYASFKSQATVPSATMGYGLIYTNSTDGQLYYNSVAAGNTLISGSSSASGSALSVKGAPYFAQGNGTTDDTTAIQTAVNDAYGQGKYVFFPAGTYLVTSTINIPSFTTVVGIPELSIVYGTGNSLPLFTISNSAQEIIVKDMVFNSNGVPATSAKAGIVGGGLDTFTIDNCRFNGMLFGLQFGNNLVPRVPAYRVTVKNCRFSNLSVLGLNGRFIASQLISNTFINVVGAAFSLPGPCNDLLIANNIVDTCSEFFSMNGAGTSYGINIIGNTSLNSTSNTQADLTIFGCTNINISNNVIDNSNCPIGIYVFSGTKSFTIANNTIMSSGTATPLAISIGNGGQCSDGTIIGNNIARRDGYYSSTAGVILYDGYRVSISNNAISNIVPGITLYNAVSSTAPISEITISGNTLSVDPGTTLFGTLSGGSDFAGIDILGGTTKVLVQNNIIGGYQYGFAINSLGGALGSPNGIVIRNNAVHNAQQLGFDAVAASASNVLIENNFLDTGNNLWTANGTNIVSRNNRYYTTTFAANTTVTSNTMDVSQVDILEPASGTISNFVNGWIGQTIRIKATGAVTISNGTNIKLANGVNFVMANGDTLQLVQLDSGVWNEVSRKTATSSHSVFSAITTVSSTYSVGANDYMIKIDATSGAFTVTLPDATLNTGRILIFKKIDNSANNTTIGTASAQTIDGATTYMIASQYTSITVQSDGTNWFLT